MARRIDVVSPIEAEALTFARQEIAHWHASGTRWSPASPLSEEASRAFVRSQMRHAAQLSAYTRMQVILLAREGDEDARAVLRDLILESRARRQELPTDLENYEMELVHGGMGHQPPGPKRKNKMLRNITIAATVAAVADRYGLTPTASSPHRQSACAIVAEALTAMHRGMGVAQARGVGMAS
jgi:hypothetical protein